MAAPARVHDSDSSPYLAENYHHRIDSSTSLPSIAQQPGHATATVEYPNDSPLESSSPMARGRLSVPIRTPPGSSSPTLAHYQNRYAPRSSSPLASSPVASPLASPVLPPRRHISQSPSLVPATQTNAADPLPPTVIDVTGAQHPIAGSAHSQPSLYASSSSSHASANATVSAAAARLHSESAFNPLAQSDPHAAPASSGRHPQSTLTIHRSVSPRVTRRTSDASAFPSSSSASAAAAASSHSATLHSPSPTRRPLLPVTTLLPAVGQPRVRGHSAVGIRLTASGSQTARALSSLSSSSYAAASDSDDQYDEYATCGASTDDDSAAYLGGERPATARLHVPAGAASSSSSSSSPVRAPNNSRLLRVHKQHSRSRCNSFAGADSVREVCSVDDPPSHVASLQELKQVDLSQFTIRAPGSASVNPLSQLPTADRVSISLSNKTGGMFESRHDFCDTWTALPTLVRLWKERLLPSDGLISCDCLERGYQLEFGEQGMSMSTQEELEIEDRDKDIGYYEKYFYSTDHLNYAAIDDELGPLIMSIQTEPLWKRGKRRLFRCLLRTKEGDLRVVLSASSAPSVIKAMRTFSDGKYAALKWAKIKDRALVEQLRTFERNLLVSSYKFGLLLCKSGQDDENAMFSNVDTTPDFDEFCDFLGDRITLQGWSRFAAGLDTKTGTTGKTSIYTQFKDFEIMFHVSTMLPFHVKDKQQLERKRHIGNDVCVVVFLESDADIFSPETLVSHFNHVFFVVTKDRETSEKFGETHYRINVAHKPGVPPASPPLPDPPVFRKDADLKAFLHCKLINTERAAMYAPAFVKKMTRTRHALLHGTYCSVVGT